MSSNTPVTFTIVRHEQIDESGTFGQRILVSVDCTMGDLDRLYSEYTGFMVQMHGVQIALFLCDPLDTPITKHRARQQYSTLAPREQVCTCDPFMPCEHDKPLDPFRESPLITEDSKGRLVIHHEREKVTDDPPIYNDWNDL